MVRQRAHRNKGLRGPSRGSTRDKTKIDFFKPEIWAIYQHASILSPSIRSPHGSANGYASMETYLLFALYLLLSMESLEPSGSPIALELRASFSARREASTPVIYLFSLVSTFPKLYQVKINNSTTVQQQQHTQYHYTHYLFIYF